MDPRNGAKSVAESTKTQYTVVHPKLNFQPCPMGWLTTRRIGVKSVGMPVFHFIRDQAAAGYQAWSLTLLPHDKLSLYLFDKFSQVVGCPLPCSPLYPLQPEKLGNKHATMVAIYPMGEGAIGLSAKPLSRPATLDSSLKFCQPAFVCLYILECLFLFCSTQIIELAGVFPNLCTPLLVG